MKIRNIFLSFSMLIGVIVPFQPYRAQAAFPQSSLNWQQDSHGLSITNNTDKMTAGLSFILKSENYPRISLQGGVQGDNNALNGPVGIDLGTIQFSPVSGTVGLKSETTDWAHDELLYQDNSTNQMKVIVSRITPAMLVQSNSSTLTFFNGNVSGNIKSGNNVNPRAAGPAFPKYIAYSSNGAVRVDRLSTSSISLNTMDQNWFAIWYGSNSHFVDSTRPLSYSGDIWEWATLPQTEGYQADSVILFEFENKPMSVSGPSSGGISVKFSSGSGNLSIMPLYGRIHPQSAQTDSWGTQLPADALTRINFWNNHSCEFPLTVSETYDYQDAIDTATISETMTFQRVCPGGIRFAPIPPFLGIAKDNLPVTFSSPLVSSNLNTEFGPILGIENVSSYIWYLSGLKKYTDAQRITSNALSPPPDLESELNSQVQRIISDGHYAPWLYTVSIPRIDYHGDAYFLNPADNLYTLIEIADAVKEPLKSQLLQRIQQERTAYPPETVYNLPLDQGFVRGPFSVSGADAYTRWEQARPDVFLKKVPLYNFYSLYRYYRLTGQAVPDALFQNALATFNSAMSEQDWATSYWFKGFDDRRIAIENVNRHFTGLIGFIGLAKQSGHTPEEKLARAAFAKAAVMRVAFASYPTYLYSSGITSVPSLPDWQVRYSAGKWLGVIFNYNWVGPADDIRSIQNADQFNIYLFDHSGFMDSAAGAWEWGPPSAGIDPLRDSTPELLRFIADNSADSMLNFEKKYVALFPQWYMTFAEGALGQEQNVMHPTDSYQVFLIKEFIKKESPDLLAKYLDIPYLTSGDLFYIHKLAEVVKTYQGVAWDNQLGIGGFPGNGSIYLNWDIKTTLPAGSSFRINYSGPSGTQPSPIANIPPGTRFYEIKGLKNYASYTLWLDLMVNGQVISTSPKITLSPADNIFYLPLLNRMYH